MIERIRPRPDPSRYMVPRSEVLGEKISPGRPRDLIALQRRQRPYRLTLLGFARATNTDPKNMRTLVDHKILPIEKVDGIETIWHRIDQRRSDYFLQWADELPVPKTVEDFDQIFLARALLNLSVDVPHPSHIVKGAADFLKELGITRSEELPNLLHCTLEPKNPVITSFKKLMDRTANVSRSGAGLDDVRKLLPKELQTLAGTALDTALGSELLSPDERILGDLLGLGPLRTPGIVYMLTLAANVPSDVHLNRSMIDLRRLDRRIDQSDSASDALLHLLSQASGRGGSRHRAWRQLDLWAAMRNSLNTIKWRHEYDAEKFLKLPGEKLAAQIAKQLTALRGNIDVGGARLATSASLANSLFEISAKMDDRFREVEELSELVDCARQQIGSADLHSVPIVHKTVELGKDGERTGRMVSHVYRLHRTRHLLDQIVTSTPPEFHHYKFVKRYSKTGELPALAETFLVYEKSEGFVPWFVPLFQFDVFGGSRTLPLNLRKKRFSLIGRAELPGVQASPSHFLNFSREDMKVARVALRSGLTIVAIDEFARAMRVAHTVFNVALDTGARAGEILQMRMDGQNFGHDHDSDTAFWLAVPKRAPDDTHEVKPRRYFLSDQTMAMVVETRDRLRATLGDDLVAKPIQPYGTLKGKITPAPFLFRSAKKTFDPIVLKHFLRYLAFGLASFGVHDIRAAIAKHRLDRGDSLEQIMTFLNHSSPFTTRGYARPTPKMQRRRFLVDGQVDKTRKRIHQLAKLREWRRNWANSIT